MSMFGDLLFGPPPSNRKHKRRIFKDPILLPEELFTLAQSFLSPFSIANSLSVNKSWRNVILKSPILFRDLDLSKLGRKSEMHLIIFHANRIANLSCHTLERVSLDLTCFLNDYAKSSEGKLTGLDILLGIIHQSRETLKEVTIKLDPSVYCCTVYLIPFIMSRLRKLGKLVGISVNAPSIVSIDAKDESGLKSFSLKNNFEGAEANQKDSVKETEELILDLLVAIHEFIPEGLRLTKFEAHQWPDERGEEILAKLLPHQSTLQRLQIGFLPPLNAQDLLNFGLGCQSLAHLTINLNLLLPEDVDQEAHQVLRVPAGLKKPQSLTSLRLNLYNDTEDDEDATIYEVDWKKLAKRVGARLEELTISYSSSINPMGLLSSNLIFNSMRMLRLLHLSGMLFHYKDFHKKSAICSFPYLESLTLEDMSASTYKWFSRAHCPDLNNLSISHFHEKASMLDIEHMNALLENVSSRLCKLGIKFASRDDLYEEEEPRLEHFSMSFPRVTELNLLISESSEAYPKWLSNFSFRKLVKLTGVNKEIHQLFQKNSPELPAFSNAIIVRRICEGWFCESCMRV